MFLSIWQQRPEQIIRPRGFHRIYFLHPYESLILSLAFVSWAPVAASYSFVDELDSKMAAASLLLAMRMKHLQWNKTI